MTRKDHTIDFRFGQQKDLNTICNLLKSNRLPAEDVELQKVRLLVATNNSEVVGCIGVEKYQSDGLLRSFVVDSRLRNLGIGQQLFQYLLSYCQQSGISTLHLLTDTADQYFKSRGFTEVSRNRAPAAIQETTEFSNLCPTSCTYMVRKRLSEEVVVYHNNLYDQKIHDDTESYYWSIRGEKLMFTYFEVPPNKTFPEHKHQSEQITYVLEGDLFFGINGALYRISAGGSIIIPSNVLHKVWTEEQAVRAVDSWSPVNWKYAGN